MSGRARTTRTGTRRKAFRFSTPVRFGDIDYAGIVYYPRFFHLFHLAFEELFRARVGAHYMQILDRRGLGFPTVKAECAFREPLRFGDVADIELSVARIGTSSIDFRYRLRRAGSAAVCAEATITVVCVRRPGFTPAPVPPDLRRTFASLLAQEARH